MSRWHGKNDKNKNFQLLECSGNRRLDYLRLNQECLKFYSRLQAFCKNIFPTRFTFSIAQQKSKPEIDTARRKKENLRWSLHHDHDHSQCQKPWSTAELTRWKKKKAIKQLLSFRLSWIYLLLYLQWTLLVHVEHLKCFVVFCTRSKVSWFHFQHCFSGFFSLLVLIKMTLTVYLNCPKHLSSLVLCFSIFLYYFFRFLKRQISSVLL